MGVLGLAAALLLKVTALGSLPRETLWRAAVLMPLAGRCALVLNISLLSYARPEGGLATAFFEGLSLLPTAVALALLFGAAWLLAQWTGLAAASAAVLGLLVFALWCRAKIGGATGDTLGAGCEITETVVALAMAAVTHTGGTI
jgi:adenosylcobinamide-GDP ribazoletransferase